MKTLFKYAIILLLLASCEQPVMEYLQVSPPEETIVTHEGGKMTATVTAFERPKATSDKTWARTAVTEDGDDSYTVTVTARQNIWENERAAVITVSAGTLSKSFGITQLAAPEEESENENDNDNKENQGDNNDDGEDNTPAAPERVLKIKGERKLTAAEGEHEAVLEFETDIPLDSLTVSADEEWITPSLSEGRISLSLDANDLLEDRLSTVKLEALVEGVKALEWEILQEPEIVTPEGMVLFEDITFKKAVVDAYDTDADRQISVEEAESIERLDVSGLGIRSLTGVEPMRNLEYLDIRDNLMADPDTSKVVIVDLSDPHPFLIDVLCDDYSGINFTGCPIIVWVEGYAHPLKSTKYHLQYINDITNWDSPFLQDPINVVSNPVRGNDISREGERIYLKRHTKGPGIEISFTIHNLIDIDVESQLDERICQIYLDNLFLKEPIKSFHEYYDLVYVITEDRYRYKEDYPEKTQDSEYWDDYYLPVKYNTITTNRIRSNNQKIDIRDIFRRPESILGHEVVGHNIGRLEDEYIEKPGPPTDSSKKSKRGFYFSNTLWSDNVEEDLPWYWKQLMELPDYKNLVGILEGAWYEKDAWRPVCPRHDVNDTRHFSSCVMGPYDDGHLCALCRFVWIAYFLYDSELYLEVLPEVNSPVVNRIKYEELFENEANRQALMNYFLEYDKVNLGCSCCEFLQ